MSEGIAVHAAPERPRLLQATGIVMVATLTSAVFGLLRETLVASRFGTTVETDAYFFAFGLMVSLPEFLLAAIAASLIPVYTRSKKEGDVTGFVSTVINVYLLFLLVVAVAIVAATGLRIPAAALGFDTAGRETVARMIWLLSPTIVLAGLWGILMTLLEAERKFFVAAITRAFLSIGIIGAILLFSEQVGIFSLPLGILASSIFQVAWGVTWLRRNGFRYRLALDLGNPNFRRFIALLGPGIAGGLIGYLEPLIDKSMASHLAAGTIASLSFAGRPMAIVTRIAVFSFITALLPSLSWEAIHRDRDRFRTTVQRTLGILVFAITPMALLLAVLRVPIIQLLFERGKFEAAATTSTANIFGGLVIGLLPMAIAVTLSTVFKSLEDTKTPAFFGAGSMLVSKVGFNFLLIGPLGAVGLALATSLGYVVSGAVLLFLLQRKLRGLGSQDLAGSFIKILAASALAVSPVFLLTSWLALPPLLSLLLGTALAAALYLPAAALLRIAEFTSVYQLLEKLKTMRSALLIYVRNLG